MVESWIKHSRALVIIHSKIRPQPSAHRHFRSRPRRPCIRHPNSTTISNYGRRKFDNFARVWVYKRRPLPPIQQLMNLRWWCGLRERVGESERSRRKAHCYAFCTRRKVSAFGWVKFDSSYELILHPIQRVSYGKPINFGWGKTGGLIFENHRKPSLLVEFTSPIFFINYTVLRQTHFPVPSVTNDHPLDASVEPLTKLRSPYVDPAAAAGLED